MSLWTSTGSHHNTPTRKRGFNESFALKMARSLQHERRTVIQNHDNPTMSLHRRRAMLMWCTMSIIFLIGSNYSALNQFPYSSSTGRRNLRTTVADTVKYYTQDDIMKTSPHFQKFIPRLLVFDGTTFQAFGLAHTGTEYFETMRYTYRYIDTIPLLIHALKTNFPDRFKPGMPPFELLFSDADSPHSECVNKKCPTDTFAPMILFGSTPKDDSIFPTLRSFPHPVYAHCMYQYVVNGVETCEWPQQPKQDIPWESLIDTVVWRGADWPFLHYHDRFRFAGADDVRQRLQTLEWKEGNRDVMLEDLSKSMVDKFTPRWRGAILSAKAAGDKTPWIDTKFVGGMNTDIHQLLAKRGVNITGERMDPEAMSHYKYQIDYGGGGGTTWEGTLTKLLMPGVLFHHETETKDWYYDLMIPWKHYVPVTWDLSDLWSVYSGAQGNQEQMKQISAEGTRLAQYMLSVDYMEEVYQELFVNYLGKLVNSYQPPSDGSEWKAMKERYKENGFDLYNIAVCKEKVCAMQCRKGLKENMLFINGDIPSRRRALASSQQVSQPLQPAQPIEPFQPFQSQQPLLPLPPLQPFQTQQTLQPLQPLQPLQELGSQSVVLPTSHQQSPEEARTPPAQVERALLPAVSSSLYITAAAEPKPIYSDVAKQNDSHGAEESTGSAEIANKAFAYIAGMSAPDPTSAPVIIPTSPPVQDRSSMYIAGNAKIEHTEPPKRAATNVALNDRSSSYIIV